MVRLLLCYLARAEILLPAVIVSYSLFFSSPPVWAGNIISPTWSGFDRWIADFDPLGHYVKAPIERAFPNLSFKGSLKQWTDFNLHNSQSVGFIEKDWNAQMAQSFLEAELRYKINPKFELVNTYNFIYDSVYNWQASEGLFAEKVDRYANYYDNFDKHILRELYLQYRSPDLQLKVGKQQVVWGKMDGQFIDIINPMDRREMLQLEPDEYEWRRIPTWMANFTSFFGSQSLQLMWIWDFEPDRLPIYGSPWWPPFVVPPEFDPSLFINGRTRKPSRDIKNHEWGIRYDLTKGALTASLIYFYAWNDNPTYFTSKLIAEKPSIRREFTRVHHIGITLDYGFELPRLPLFGLIPAVFRFEGLLTRNSYFTDYNLTNPQKGALALRGLVSHDQVKRDTFRGAMAFEFSLPNNLTLIFQPSLFYNFNWHGGLSGGYAGSDQWEFLPISYMAKSWGFTQQRLLTSFSITPLLAGPRNTWQGFNTRAVISYRFSQYISGRVIWTAFTGQTDSPVDVFGQYDKWDNLGWELSYEF